LELSAEICEDAGARDRFEGFASVHGATFSGLPQNRDTETLERSAWTVPAQFPANGEAIVPLRAGEMLRWRVIS